MLRLVACLGPSLTAWEIKDRQAGLCLYASGLRVLGLTAWEIKDRQAGKGYRCSTPVHTSHSLGNQRPSGGHNLYSPLA